MFIPITALALLRSGPPESPGSTSAVAPIRPVSRAAPRASSLTMIDRRSVVIEPVTEWSVPVPPPLPTAVTRVAHGELGRRGGLDGREVRGAGEAEHRDVVGHGIAGDIRGVGAVRSRDDDRDPRRAPDHVVVGENGAGRGQHHPGAGRGRALVAEGGLDDDDAVPDGAAVVRASAMPLARAVTASTTIATASARQRPRGTRPSFEWSSRTVAFTSTLLPHPERVAASSTACRSRVGAA